MFETSDRQTKKALSKKLMSRVFLGVGIISISLAAMYMSCQPIDSENNLLNDSFSQALDADEKIEVTNLIQAMGRIETAIEEIKNINSPTATTDPVTIAIRDHLKNKCLVEGEVSSADKGDRHSFLKASGDGCLIPTNYDVNYEEELETGKYISTAGFSIQDETLKTQNDVSALNITGEGQQTIGTNQGRRLARWEGTVQSLARGSVSFRASLNENYSYNQGQLSSRGTRTIRLSFPQKSGVPSFGAEIRQDQIIESGVDRFRYTMNGVEISKAEYQTYLNQFGLIFL